MLPTNVNDIYQPSVKTLLFDPFQPRCLVELAIGTHNPLAASQVALPKEPLLLGCEGPNHTVNYTLVVEENTVSLGPVVRVHVLWRNTGALQSVDQIPNLLQICHHLSVGEMDGLDSAGVNLQGKISSDRVLPDHRKDLDIGLVDWGKLRIRELETFRYHAQSIRTGVGRRHPDVWVGGIFDLCGADEFLILLTQKVVHSLSGNKSGGPKRDIQFIASSIIVANGLASASGHVNGQEGGDLWWVERIQRSVYVPAVETCIF